MPKVRIRNGNNFLLIDETYANLAIRQSGSVVTGGANTYGYSGVSLTLANDQSVIALRCASRCFINSVQYGSGTITYNFICQGGNVTIEYWNFDLPKYSTFNPNFAKVIIRKPSTGEVVFDSRLRYMRVLNFQSINGNSSSADVVNTYGADTVPAVVFSSRAWTMRTQAIGTPLPTEQIVAWSSSAFKTSGPTVTVTPLWTYASFSDPNVGNVYPNTDAPNGYWMTLNVSNF